MKGDCVEDGGLLTSQGHRLVSQDDTLVIAVRELEHLFVDPPQNPFSPYEVELTGESGLKRIVRWLSATSAGAMAPYYRIGHKHKRLLILLPGEPISSETTQQARDALKRYCEFKIADNEKEIFIAKRQARRLLLFGFLLMMGCLIVSLILSSDTITTTTFWTATLAEGFNIIGWVLLWHPFEAWMYDAIPLTIESRVFAFLNGLDLQVQPQTSPKPPTASP